MTDPEHPCPWCPCTFYTSEDLRLHLLAFSSSTKPPNQYDHKWMWREEIKRRNRYNE